jgi:hypothetical protein
MLDSKLVESIQSLNQVEQSEFASFLDSRFFQREYSIQQLKHLLVLILAALKNSGEEGGLTKENVHEEVFREKEYSENRVDRIMFELNRLLKTFLLVKHYLRPENHLEQTLNWSEIQRSKGKEANVDKQLKKLRQTYAQKREASPESYFDQYLLSKEEHEWLSIFNKAKGDLGIPQAIEALDYFYYAQRLELLNRFLLQQRISSVQTPVLIQQEFGVFLVPEHYLEQSSVLRITHKINQLFEAPQPSVVGVEELMALLRFHEPDLPPKQLAQFYAYLRNFCTLLFDAGNMAFDGILHTLQRDNLQRGYFYHEGKIHPNAFLNITQHAIRAQNITWAREFMQAHKDKILGEDESRECYRMNEALCLFAEKKYEAALEAIPFGSNYVAYHLMARRLELKIYYELRSSLLYPKVDAFKMFINRSRNKSFPKRLVELFANFGNFVHQLCLSIPGDKKRSDLLVRRIQAKKLVGERSWLLEKARELAQAKKT